MDERDDMIEFVNVDLDRGRRLVLEGVNWRVRAGEHWAIVGANGSGKTSLLQVATGYLWPTRGHVSVLGQAFGEVDLRVLRRAIGWVSASLGPLLRTHQPALSIALSGAFASTGLFDRPSPPQVLQAEELLQRVGCRELAQAPFATLSLGEQQRVLIARALMAQPRLLILDEACAGLDLPGREDLLDVLDGLGRDDGPSMVLVTHHIEEISPVFTHVLALRGGRVVASGPKERVLTSAILSRTFGLGIEVERQFGRYWPRVSARRG